MNKLSLVLVAGFLLVGCASEPVKYPDALPNGIMQPVEGTGAVAGGSFMPEIQKNTIPTQMK
ncbi:hypothetical protein [Haemophilus influenzae]|uniref:hypothetical protein n=1 Tax=Haemophilus influenzae TaxID=727 RepID=UPI00014F85C3|nr:hypothetical protein [Haemophilus influenzae]EDJ87881.1 hypothetical protein CGSHi22121_01082 [Haemophilus influenzae 22.1-21]KIP31903.1 membrane protein [Haemophilus influenzae]MCK8803063.1 hypothetical protein [Haemophilus influenzae]MCK8858576.1 hypothetical protein [Haemophilus influenzae]MCK8886393.1 hypothetical protein [Haemophilus influenzae]